MSQIADNVPGHYFAGPGYNSIITVPSNKVDIMDNHSWLSGSVGKTPGRIVLIDKICWTESNWPFIGIVGTPSHEELPDPRSDEFANMPIAGRLTFDTIVTIASFQWKVHCWDSSTGTNEGKCAYKNYYFYVRNGLAGYGTVSFESVTEPSSNLRHYDEKLRIDPNNNSSLFKLDSSFIPVAGFQELNYLSLRTINYLFDCIRHYEGLIITNSWDSSKAEDFTWRIEIK